jgi:hypothetical protein
VIPTGAAHVGSTFGLATQTTNGTSMRIYAIDDQTAAVRASVAIPNPTGGSSPSLTAVGGGFALTFSRGTGLAFARARENLAGGFALADLLTGSAASGSAVAIDAKHAALVYQDGKVKAVQLSCGP